MPAFLRGRVSSPQHLQDHTLLLHGPQGRHAALLLVPRVAEHPGVLLPLEHLGQGVVGDGLSALGGMAFQRSHNLRHGLAVEKHALRAPQHPRLGLVYLIIALHNIPAVQLLAIGHAPLGVLLDAVHYALGQLGALPLGQHILQAKLQDGIRAGADALA